MLTRNINYIGWLGHNNLGDEALYSVIQKFLSPYELRPYDCYNDLTASLAQICRQPKNEHSHVSVFGGGTLLPDDITWIKPARYNYLFGAAVKNPSFPSNFNSFDPVIIERLKKFRFRLIGVRDYFSKDSLSQLGIESEVIGDPVLSLTPRPDIKRNQTRVGINVGCDGFLWGNDQNRVVKEMLHVCKTLKIRGYDPILVPFSKQDIPYTEMLSEKANIPIFHNWTNLQSVMDLIATCQILIGQRMHSLIMSAATYTPFVCLEYRPKCNAFSETVGFLDYCIRTDNVTAEQTMEKFHDLLNNWTKMRDLLKQKVDNYRQIQVKFAERIRKDLEFLPENAWTIDVVRQQLKQKLFWNNDVFLRRRANNLWKSYNRLIFLHMMSHLI
jgi:hypothetical protein